MAGPSMITLMRTEEYSDNAEQQLREMRSDRDFTDVNIIVGDRTFPCHRVTLAVNSPMLKRMLKSDMKEVREGTINLEDKQPDIIEMVLDYIYYGTITFHDENLMGLIYTADFLLMGELKTRCVGQVVEHLSLENVLSWLQVGDDLNIVEMKSRCTEIMISHMFEISKQADFLSMTCDQIHKCVTNELPSNTDCHDDRLFAVMDWVNHDTKNRIMHFEHLIHPAQLAQCSKFAAHFFLWFCYIYYCPNSEKVSVFNADYIQNITRSIKHTHFEEHICKCLITVGGHVELQK